MDYKQFWSKGDKFGDSPSMFDTNGKLIKNHIKWEDYCFINDSSKKNSINNSKKKLNNYFCLN